MLVLVLVVNQHVMLLKNIFQDLLKDKIPARHYSDVPAHTRDYLDLLGCSRWAEFIRDLRFVRYEKHQKDPANPNAPVGSYVCVKRDDKTAKFFNRKEKIAKETFGSDELAELEM